ncbi:unnamed protein product [Meloidogyne enterolobii]|uniref:Uncharacterized protein n=1 Tax=Meloidogyne enterolobii TaxID=390850 RepID=A0ACB0ZLC9_MELEN
MMIHIQRLILTIETRAHKGLLRIAINGLKDDDGKPVTEGQRIGSQHKALDTLIWILEEWKSNVHSSELQKLTRNAIDLFSDLLLDSIPSILQSAYVNSSSRTISHKWTILLCDFIQIIQWPPTGLSLNKAFQFMNTLFVGLTKLLEELFKVQRASSLHWLFVLIGCVVEDCTITPLSAKFPQLADSADKFMLKCVEVLTLIGRCWSKQWTNSLHSKLSREYGLSGFIFDETMFDFPVKVLSSVSGVLQPPSTAQLDQQQSNLKKGCLSKQKASKNATSFTTSQQPKLVWATAKPSFDEIYTEDKQQSSPWFAAPGIFFHFFMKKFVFSGSPYIPPPSFTGNFSVDQDLWKTTPSANTFQQWTNTPIYDFGNSNLISDLIEDSKFAIEQTKLALEQSKLCRQMVENQTSSAANTSRVYSENNKFPLTFCSTASILSDYAIDEMDWMDMFFIDDSTDCNLRFYGDILNNENGQGSNNAKNPHKNIFPSVGLSSEWPKNLSGNMLPSTYGDLSGYQTAWKDTNDTNKNGNPSTSSSLHRHHLLMNHLTGLLETEPLIFSCVYGTDHIRVLNEQENENFDLPTTFSSDLNKKGETCDDGREQMDKVADIYSLKHQLQYQQHRLKNRQQQKFSTNSVNDNNSNNALMDIFAAASVTENSTLDNKKENESTKELDTANEVVDVINTQSEVNVNSQLPSGENTPATLGLSSASTFGVPTTPKTTPFQLTPTPLSPIGGSEADLEELVMLTGESDINHQKSESLPIQNGSVTQTLKQLNRKFSPHSSFFTQLPRISLCIDRMTAGAQKFIVLDFGYRVMLSDLIVPASEYMSSLRIDAWLKDEKTDSIFVASTSEIGAKSLTISDLLPPIICRFLKLYNEPCTVNLGQFFGAKMVDFEEDLEENNILSELIFLSDSLKVAYECSANAIKGILRDDGNPTFEQIRRRSIRQQYRECFALRLEYNIVRNLITRIQMDNKVLDENEKKELKQQQSGWSMIGLEQLAVMAHRLIALLNLFSAFTDARKMIVLPPTNQSIPTVSISQNNLLSLDTAVLHFGLFCMDSLPRLRAECISWLFHYGVYTNWWGKFFVEVLNQHFASKMCQKNLDSAFIILSYLCSETVKYPRFQTNIIEQLVLSVLAQLGVSSTDIDINLSTLKQPRSVNFKILLSWTLMLISSAFDIIISKKRQNDRWLFLGGDFGPANSGTADQFNATTCPTLQRGYAIKKKYGTAKFAGPSSFVNVPNVAPSSSSQSKMITPVKNHYKTLIDKLEKMKQSETISLAKLEKLKVHLMHIQSLYSNFNQLSAEDKEKSGKFPDKSGKTSKSPASTSAVIPDTKSTKTRQYSIHLRLSPQLCRLFVKSLLQLLCEHSTDATQLQIQTLLLVIAKICVHGSAQPIPVSVAFDTHLQQLFSLAFNDFDEPWIRHALLSMLLDISEAEIRSLSRITNVDSSGNSAKRDEKMDTEGCCAGAFSSMNDAKRRKEEQTTNDLPVSDGTSEKILQQIEKTINETLFNDDDEIIAEDVIPDDTAPIVDEGHNQFFDNLIDTTLSEATTMAAANLAPSSTSNSQNVKATESTSNRSSEIWQFDLIALQMFNVSRLNLANNINIQPIALSVDLQYDFCVSEKQAITNCNDSVFLQDTLIRNSFRRLLLLRSLPPSNSSNDENVMNEEKRDEAIGQCMQTIMGAIDQLFTNLRADNKNSNVRPAFVERLLDFYWQYQSNIGAFLNSKSNLSIAKSPLFTVPALSDNAACSLISYAADNPFISELVWTRVLTTLNTSIQKMPYLIESIVGSGKLFGFFQYFCFIGPSCRVPNMPPNTEIGPSLDSVFEYFVHLLINKSNSSLVTLVVDILLDVLISVFSKRNFITLSKFSLGALLKISSVLAQFTQKYVNNCSLPKVARLYCVLLAYSKKMVQRAVDPDAPGQFLPGEEENTSSVSSNVFGIYSHYGNGQSFSVINAPAKNICFSNMDSENHFGITNDPLDYIGGPAISSYEKMDGKIDGGFNSCWGVSTPPFSSTFSSSGIPITSSLSKKKVTPKTTKSMAQKQIGIGSISNMPVDEEHLEIIDQNDLATSYFGMCPTAWITVGPGSMPPPPPPHYGVPFHSWTGTSSTRKGTKRMESPSVVVMHANKIETVLCNLFKSICVVARDNHNLAQMLLEDDLNVFLSDSFEFLSYCVLNNGQTLDSVSVEKWKIVSLADAILFSVLTITKHMEINMFTSDTDDESSRRLMQLLVQNLVKSKVSNAASGQSSNMETRGN